MNMVPSLEEHQVKHSNLRKARVPQIISRGEMIPWLILKRYANFPKAPQGDVSLSYLYVRGPLNLLLQVDWTQR